MSVISEYPVFLFQVYKPVLKIQSYVCIKQLQDGNERQDPVNQKHPELIQIQKKVNK